MLRLNPWIPSAVGIGLWRDVWEGEQEAQRTIRMRGYLSADNWGDAVASAEAISDSLIADYMYPWAERRWGQNL